MSGSLASYGVGLLALTLVLVLWVFVQRAWGQVFSGHCTDPDVLAGRGGCSGCRSNKKCQRRPPGAGDLEGMS